MHRMVSRTRIGDGVVDHAEWQTRERDGGSYYIRDRVVVVPKGAVISDGIRLYRLVTSLHPANGQT